MRQFLRKVRVTFNGGFVVNPADTVGVELRVAFSASRTISGSANPFEIKIFNLNAGHRNSVGKEFDEVQLEAGYVPPEGGGNLGIIAKGFVRDVQHDRDGPDIITTLTCGDGDKAFRKAAISKTFPTGTPVKDIVEEIYGKMQPFGVEKGEWKFPDDIRTIKRPYSICGGCARELNVLGRSNDFYWSVQNGVMEVIPADDHLAGSVLISAETGMIGSPTITDNGVKVKCLLNPGIRPNRTVIVKSEVLEMNAEDDTYRVSQVDFSGDNQTGDFVADVHGEAISGGKVDEGVS
jgi:hypothetical protein